MASKAATAATGAFGIGLPRSSRVWALAFVVYGACFGMELTIDNIAALYFTDYFHLALTAAGIVAGSFGMMNLFARALGGLVSDRLHQNFGLRGRTMAARSATILAEGLALDVVLSDAFLAFRHRRDDAYRTLPENGERGDLFPGAFRE